MILLSTDWLQIYEPFKPLSVAPGMSSSEGELEEIVQAMSSQAAPQLPPESSWRTLISVELTRTAPGVCGRQPRARGV